MPRKLLAVLLTFFATCGCCTCGCCTCDNSCDYLPPVLDGPYSNGGGRRSIIASASMAREEITPAPTHVEIASEPITPLEATQ